MPRRQAEAPEYADAISLPLEFELERSDLRARNVILSVLSFVALSLVMLAIAPFNSVVVAPGAIAPRGEAVAAHHDRGGVIEALHVARGSVVRAGQPIMTLRSTELVSEINELAARRSALKLQIERLRSLLDEREPNFGGISSTEEASLVERAALEAERTALEAELAALDAQRETRLRTAAAYDREAELLETASIALGERRDMVAQLVRKGAAPRAELLEASTRLGDTQARIAGVRGSETEALKQADELARKVGSLIAERRARWSTSLSEAVAELASVEEQISRRRLTLEARTIVAPVAGRILRIGGGGPGAALEPGGLAAEIVPSDRMLIAEIRIPPEKIGHVKVGDQARLFISTYDEIDIGEVLGEIVSISPSAIQAPEGETFYQAEVSLPAGMIKRDLLRPGMTLSANILGAQRTILGYLLNPFEKALAAAFREE